MANIAARTERRREAKPAPGIALADRPPVASHSQVDTEGRLAARDTLAGKWVLDDREAWLGN